jgi:hypothetical protein
MWPSVLSFFSCSIMFLRFIYFIICISILFLFKLSGMLFYVYTFVYPLINRRTLGLFAHFSIVNSDAVNIPVQVFCEYLFSMFWDI